jgi:hypothetical protein
MEEKIIYDVEVKGVQSIENLTKANKELREERKKLDLQSEQGIKRAQEINKQLDANTEIIKENSSALEKQRLNVGNYTGALDKLVPGLGATANGFTSMRTTAMAFIATPIGAVIGALGLALGALTAYFKGSEEGQDSLSKVMNIGKVIFEQVTVVVEKLGEVVFKTISFVADLAMKVIDFVAPQIGNMLQQSIDAANKITELEDSIDARENELIVRRAENAKKVAQLREQALSLEGNAKRKVIQEAIDLEKQLAREETEQAANRLLLLEEQIKVGGNATEEQKKQRAELTAARIKAETDEYSSTLRFQKELEKLREEELKKQEKLNEQRAIEIQQKKDLADINERLNEQTDVELPKLELKIKGKDTMNKALDGLIKKNQEVSKSEKQRVKDAEDSSDKQVKAAVALSAAVIGLGKSDTKAKKALGLSTIAINSGIGVSEAIKAGAGKPWPLNLAAILSGITAVLTGITQAKGLLGYATGGLTGTRIMAHHGTRINRSNGDNLLATVKTGEVILNRDQQARLGGDRTFARIGVPGFATGGIVSDTAKKSESISYQFQLYDAIRSIQPVVTVEDINAGQSRVMVIQNRAQVI